ncbi:agamous-like MADS-box protein AGL82 [Camellia sinensis]|uniref:agamous-like MADS-box protein AGL82 n=1 Tax=Camellia sinensis TaxID=4442 RepID=UPI00103668E9|nr:agamous-like MADS-box protein AGL82 [Camellia sinensis]
MKRIENKKALRVTYMKRKDSVIKRTMELSILCGINIVTTLFSAQWRGQHVAPNPNEVKALIKMYKESAKKSLAKKSRESSFSDCCLGAEKVARKERTVLSKGQWSSRFSAVSISSHSVFGPNGEVNTWPQNPNEVKALIKMYKESAKKSLAKKSRESSFSDCCLGAEKVAKKVLMGNKDGYGLLDGLSVESVISFLEKLESKLEVLKARIEFLKMLNEQKNRVLVMGKET